MIGPHAAAQLTQSDRAAGRAATRQNRGGAGAAQRRAQERSAARREAILAAALEEFSARGFEAARLDDVARRAGVAKGTIYLYFRDKESLFQELIRTMLTPLDRHHRGAGRGRRADAPCSASDRRIVRARDLRDAPQGRDPADDHRRPRFPKLAEFYYREVLSRIIAAVRALLQARRRARRGARRRWPNFRRSIAAPGLVAIIWSGLFERFEPLDVRAMMRAHVDLLFAPRRAP